MRFVANLSARTQPIASSAALICDPEQGDWAMLSRTISAWGVPTHLFDFGQGAADRPDTRAPVDAAAAMLARLDSYEPPVHLVGRGLGAAIALDVARRRPSRIASLTLIDPYALQLLRSAGPGLSRSMRLDVLRRTGFPLLFIETSAAAPDVAMATRRVQWGARRGRYRVAGQGGGSPANAWREVIDAVARQVEAGLPDQPALFAAAA